MLNLFNKTKPWLVASLLGAVTAFAQDNNTKCRPQKGFDQGHEMMQNQMMPAYSAPARVEVRGSWDVYATGTFLYWQAREDGLEPGLLTNQSPDEGLSGTVSPAQTTVILPNFEYKPGFKVGLGVNLDWDNWDAYAEYTWFHGTTTTNVSPLVPVGTVPATIQAGGYLLNNLEFGTNVGSNGFAADVYFNSSKQSWNLKMDFLDISLARSSYSGMKLSVRPFFGARGAWIRQKLTNTYVGNTTTGGVSVNNQTLTGTQSDVSWGVGPRTGFESNWMMGYGFRAIGNGSADVLYTRYNLKDTYSLFLTSTGAVQQSGKTKAHHLDALRAHVDLDLGIGWGSYFDNNNWHIDFAATYGFQVFWGQNMFMNNDIYYPSFLVPTGNLYVHGLDLKVRLDF